MSAAALADGDTIFSSTAIDLSNYWQAPTDFGFAAEGDDGTTSVNFNPISAPGAVTNDVWYNILWSSNIAFLPGSRLESLYIGDTSIFSTLNHDTGATAAAVQRWNVPFLLATFYPDVVRFADVWMTMSHDIDFSVAGNRAKFHDGSGKPVSLGSNGSTPFGYQPEIFFTGDHTAFPTNQGTGGAFSLVGTITDAASHP